MRQSTNSSERRKCGLKTEEQLIRGKRVCILIPAITSFRVSMLHKKVQELRHEKCQIAKAAERERLNNEEQKNQLLQQIHLVSFFLSFSSERKAESRKLIFEWQLSKRMFELSIAN